jgi:predicted rRNA methylase YqxC with S4 and FtsJ domains
MLGSYDDTRIALLTLLAENVAALQEVRSACLLELVTADGSLTDKSPRPLLLAVSESLRKHIETAMRVKDQFSVQEEFTEFKAGIMKVLREVDPSVAQRVWEALGDDEPDERPARTKAKTWDDAEPEEDEEE